MVSHFLTIVPMWDTIMVCRAVVWERKSSVVPVSWRKKTELERVSRGVSESDELSSFRKQDKKYFFYRCLLVGISVRPGRMSPLYPCFLFLKTLGRFHFFLPSPLFHGIQSRLISGGVIGCRIDYRNSPSFPSHFCTLGSRWTSRFLSKTRTWYLQLLYSMHKLASWSRIFLVSYNPCLILNLFGRMRN